MLVNKIEKAIYSVSWALSSIQNDYFLLKLRSEIYSRINETILFIDRWKYHWVADSIK